ncbi:MAG: ThiF family adenylyltransferase [Pseudomonadota bacterium]
MENWWDRFPEAFEAEQAALDAWGEPWTIDKAEFGAGRLVVRIATKVAGQVRELLAIYPDSYPYFMPQVEMREVQLPKHHNRHGYLCLLADDGALWRPGTDTLAGLLQEQLPRLELVTNPTADADVVAENEDHVAEPIANYLPYTDRSAIIVPDELPPKAATSGGLQLLARQGGGRSWIVAILKQVTDINSEPLVDFPVELLSFNERISGFWVRLKERPNLGISTDPEALNQLYKLAFEGLPAFQKRLRTAREGAVFVLGLLYEDEVTWRESGEDWVFIWVKITKSAKGGRNPSSAEAEYSFVRADWAGERSLLMRAPALAPLRMKSVLLVGLGAIGSPLALQLAKSGVREIHAIDMDHLQVGNSVRWALGWSLSGHPKSGVIASHVQNEYPRTKVIPSGIRIGAHAMTPEGAPFSDYNFLRGLTEGVDLVIDASANYRVNHLLADMATREKKPYLWLSTTSGAAGGLVGRVVPGRTAGCWHCCQLALTTGKVAPPTDAGTTEVQPRGCTHPTFVAAGIDSDEVALLAARVAVATLVAQDGESGQAADFAWDLAVGDFFEGPRRIAPRWATYPLEVHPECKFCGTVV